MPKSRAALAATLISLFSLAAPAHASCGSAFCLINTQWGLQGLWSEPGGRADLRYEFIDQDQPRAGRDAVGVGEIPRHHDEVRTLNRNLIATLDYGFDAAWGVSFALPVVSRDHRHIHNHHGEKLDESWQFTRLGDARVLGRYQFPAVQEETGRTRFVGLLFGAKLPTGSFDVTNDEGEAAERTLQPGSGTTDAVLGASYREVLSRLRSSGSHRCRRRCTAGATIGRAARRASTWAGATRPPAASGWWCRPTARPRGATAATRRKRRIPAAACCRSRRGRPMRWTAARRSTPSCNCRSTRTSTACN